MNATRWKNDLIGAAGGWQNMVDWTDETGRTTPPEAIRFDGGGEIGNTAAAPGVAMTKGPKLIDLVIFAGTDGTAPAGGLIADAAGDLFGTTELGGPNGDGTVFEVVKTGHGYASAPITLVSFTGADGDSPSGSLIVDAEGDLFGKTITGGTNNDGTVFEIAKTQNGYAGAPTTLVNFTGDYGPFAIGGLIADAAGNLIGTSQFGGADGDGAVFEIAKTAGGYASAPTMLVSFTGADGEHPYGGLLVDAAGDLFGTTISGGANDEGTVFEIAKSEGGYAGAPTTLVNFTGADGSAPYGALIADAAGDLFGTTAYGGIDNQGTVFEIAKTDGGYAGAPATIVKFTGADGAYPLDSLILDAAGDLFGTTVGGGTRNHGVVFEIAKTDGGYAGAPTTLVLLKTAHGLYPLGGLIADAAGNLFGTALDGGVDNNGAVFEIRHGGFVPPAAPLQSANKPSPLGAAFVQAMAGHGQRGFVGNSLAIFASQHEARTLLAPPNIA